MPTRDDIVALLAAAPNAREHVWLQGPEPAPHSLARHELDQPDEASLSRASVDRPIQCADLWMLIAADQLHGLSMLIQDGTTAFAIFPLLRSVIEHNAWATYVLDDQASLRTRAVRAALATLRSQDELVQAAALMAGKEDSAYQAARATQKRLRHEIEQEFGTLDLSGTMTLDGESVASPTDVVKHFGERWWTERRSSGLYGYLCGVANHPSLSAYEYLDRDDSGRAAPTIGDQTLTRLLVATIVPHLKALKYLTCYMGWPRTAADDYIDQANKTLGNVLT